MEEKQLEAVGISYDEKQGKAPILSAKGVADRAQAIVDMAKDLGIYVHKDEVLLNELKKLDEGEEVPADLYNIIATILAFSYVLQGRTPEKWKRADGTVAINVKA